MSEFTSEQIAVSTAEDERNYFTGQVEGGVHPTPSTILPAGTYRVIEGHLYRVRGGIPPSFAATSSPESSSVFELSD